MGDTKFRMTGRRTAQGPYRDQVKERKRQEAEVRNAAWQRLSRDQKIEIIRTRPGRNLKQLKQLGCIPQDYVPADFV